MIEALRRMMSNPTNEVCCDGVTEDFVRLYLLKPNNPEIPRSIFYKCIDCRKYMFRWYTSSYLSSKIRGAMGIFRNVDKLLELLKIIEAEQEMTRL
jgi:hypothetical protein